ncbi:MAG: glycolate oxidase subunit GlcE [Proteobacteria bacterium]|nr:glycolate oxidase subunit GlcE [Pseudomonadota bacterium]
MENSFKPANADQLHDVIGWAAAETTTLEVVGHGSKHGLGRPSQCDCVLDLSDITGIVSYQPEELVLQVAAGTPVAEIEQTVADKNQQLAFEPADYGRLFGAEAGRGTIGGVFACNLSGPRRIKSGAARDHLLGAKAVSGRGELFKSGGQVVKNVTGYDLCKLLAGSYGTLAAIHEVTLKVMPAPEKVRTVLVLGLDDEAAIGLLGDVAGSGFEPTGLAHLPHDISRASHVSFVADAGTSVTALRLEGPGPSVEHRCGELRKWLAARGPLEELHRHNSATLWREVRDVAGLADAGMANHAIWRLSVPPTRGAEVVRQINQALPAQGLFDWAGGLVWLAIAGSATASEPHIRAAVADVGGHATLMRAPAEARAAVPVFQPQPGPLAQLSRRIKENFDPKGILNPGRMYAGV